MLNDEEVKWGYRYVLGRDPESEVTAASQAQSFLDWREFRGSLLNSQEFKASAIYRNLPPKWVASEIFGGKRTIWLDLNDDFVSRGALMDSYEKLETEVVSALLREGDVFLDVGANIGWYTLLASTLVGRAGHIHAFEPRESTQGYLRRSVAMNGLGSIVTVHNFGLGDMVGELLLGWAHSGRNPGHSHFVDAEGPDIETIKISVKTLDSLNLSKFDFIKLDVEGAEPKVIAGGRSSIQKHRPFIMSELYPEQLRVVSKTTPKDYIGIFSEMDYQAFIVDQSNLGDLVKDFPTNSPWDLTNIILVPAEKIGKAAEMLALAGLELPGLMRSAVRAPAKTPEATGGGLVTREQIRDAYVFILGREPESEEAYAAHAEVGSLFELRQILLTSEEYLSQVLPAVAAQARNALFFVHPPQTGGAALKEALAANFPRERVLTAADDQRAFSPLDSSAFDFFFATCDYETARALPRQSMKIISIFRKPTDRLMALYQWCRSLPVHDDLKPTHAVRLANNLSPEDFFSHPEIRNIPEINNIYLRIFGTSLRRPIDQSPMRRAEELATLEFACARVRGLDGIALTHRMQESIELVCRSIGFPLPAPHPQLRNVLAVEMTERLAKALEELTCHDEMIYQAAVDEFERRLQAEDKREDAAAGSKKQARRSRTGRSRT
jgi:FkbM family methyltransferase